MAHAKKIQALLSLLARERANPLSVRRYRTAVLTLLSLEDGGVWQWEPQAADGGEMAALVFMQGPVRVETPGGHAVETTASDGIFLHPSRACSVFATDAATSICVWVPWDAIAEVDDGTRRSALVVPTTPLAVGLKAFAGALLARTVDNTPYTEYLMEKVIAEMVFGVVLETSEGAAPPVRQIKPLDRARTLMLIRRGDPSFGVDEIARELHVSTRQLQRIFSVTGSTPADELRRLRVELARDLLRSPEFAPLSIEDVASHSGFGTAAALRRAFSAMSLPTPRRERHPGGDRSGG